MNIDTYINNLSALVSSKAGYQIVGLFQETRTIIFANSNYIEVKDMYNRIKELEHYRVRYEKLIIEDPCGCRIDTYETGR
jgi:hypothetical protein